MTKKSTCGPDAFVGALVGLTHIHFTLHNGLDAGITFHMKHLSTLLEHHNL